MVTRAGSPLSDMGAVQFHPTGNMVLAVWWLKDVEVKEVSLEIHLVKGFMTRYAPSAKDLASREMLSVEPWLWKSLEGRGVGPLKDHIYLHLNHLDPKSLTRKTSRYCWISKKANVDVTWRASSSRSNCSL